MSKKYIVKYTGTNPKADQMFLTERGILSSESTRASQFDTVTEAAQAIAAHAYRWPGCGYVPRGWSIVEVRPAEGFVEVGVV